MVFVISAIELYVKYGGVYVFHVSFDLCVIYGVGICVDFCDVVCFLSLGVAYYAVM